MWGSILVLWGQFLIDRAIVVTCHGDLLIVIQVLITICLWSRLFGCCVYVCRFIMCIVMSSHKSFWASSLTVVLLSYHSDCYRGSVNNLLVVMVVWQLCVCVCYVIYTCVLWHLPINLFGYFLWQCYCCHVRDGASRSCDDCYQTTELFALLSVWRFIMYVLKSLHKSFLGTFFDYPIVVMSWRLLSRFW